MNNPKYVNMSDKELIAHIAIVAKALRMLGDARYRMSELVDATTELDFRVNRS